MIKSGEARRPENFHLVNPNMGFSVDRATLERLFMQAEQDGEAEVRGFLAKFLNIEIGLALMSNSWAGAEHWEKRVDRTLSFQELLRRSEVVVAGIDGGGLDDLLGLTLLGREHQTRRWLHWVHAWAHEIVLERRKDIATKLLDFKADGDLTIVALPGDDVSELADILCRVKAAGLFPEKQAIGVDQAGIGDIVDELTTEERGFTMEHIVGIGQGWKLNGAIKTTERKVAGGELVHGGQPLMAWCVGNARTVQVGNAIAINKQVSGTAKIDPLMATFDAATLMALNPSACDEGDFNEFLKAPIIV